MNESIINNCFQELLQKQHQPYCVHCQRAVAVLGPVVQRGVFSVLRGPTYPQKGALSSLAHGKNFTTSSKLCEPKLDPQKLQAYF